MFPREGKSSGWKVLVGFWRMARIRAKLVRKRRIPTHPRGGAGFHSFLHMPPFLTWSLELPEPLPACSRCGEAGEDGNANLNRVARPGKSQEEPPRKTTVDRSQGLEAGVQSRGSELGPPVQLLHSVSCHRRCSLSLSSLPFSFYSHHKLIIFLSLSLL